MFFALKRSLNWVHPTSPTVWSRIPKNNWFTSYDVIIARQGQKKHALSAEKSLRPVNFRELQYTRSTSVTVQTTIGLLVWCKNLWPPLLNAWPPPGVRLWLRGCTADICTRKMNLSFFPDDTWCISFRAQYEVYLILVCAVWCMPRYPSWGFMVVQGVCKNHIMISCKFQEPESPFVRLP